MDKFGLEKELFEADKYFNQVNDNFLDKNINNPKEETTKSNPIKKQSSNVPDILLDYQKKLKLFGFPEIGAITLSSEPSEQEKTLKFFDYIIRKKASESQDFKTYQLQCDSLTKKCEVLEAQVSRYEKEIKVLNDELKKNTGNKKEYESKISKQKDSYEKQIISLKNSSTFLTNKLNKLTLDKRTLEEKYTKVAEAYAKLTTNKSKVLNSIELTDYVKQNDLCKMLSKVKGAEKLTEMLKNGYNESFRELLFEISYLKNFILDVHNDIKQLIEEPSEINEELLNMPFLDSANQIKLVFNKNLLQLREKLGLNYDEQLQYKESEILLHNNIQEIQDDDEDKILFNKKENMSISSIKETHEISNTDNIKDKISYLDKKLKDLNIVTDIPSSSNFNNDDDFGYDPTESELMKKKWSQIISKTDNL